MNINKKYLIGGLIGVGVAAAIGAAVATVVILNKKKAAADEAEPETRGLDETEAVLLDLDGDGEVDAVLEDTTGDGSIDTVSVDTTGDGEVDTVMVDLDGDGEVDVIYTSNETLASEEAPAEPQEPNTEAPASDAELFADMEGAPAE